MRYAKRLLFVALPAAVLVAAAAVAFWSAQRTLTRSAGIARNQHQIGFTLKPLDPGAMQAENPGFEPVLATEGYSSGAFLDGDLYLAGASGVSIHAADGTLKRTLRTGFELPVAPVAAVGTGRLRGMNDAEVLLATSGAGVLLLEPNPRGAPAIRQLLPATAEGRDVTSLLALASGDLLLGTRHGGVLVFNGTTLEPLRMGDGAAKLEVTALAAVDSASFLIGTRNAGVYYVHAGTVDHADAAAGLPDDQVEKIAVADGKAFVGTPLGVAQFELAQADGGFKPVRTLAAGVFSHALAVGRDGLLVGSLDQGIRRIGLQGQARVRNVAMPIRSEGLGEGGVGERVDQFLAAGGAVYAIADGALVVEGSTGWHAALGPGAAGLADRNISALGFAPDGPLYVGFFDHGLDIVTATGPDRQQIRHLEDDHLFCVNRLALDPERQTMAAATANGLVMFDRQGTPRQVLTRKDGLITFVGPAGTESLYAFQGLVNNHVYALGTSGERTLAGTLGGLSVLEGGAVRRNFTAANSGLKHNWITAIAATPEGWLVGTYGAGVAVMDADGRFSPVELPAGTAKDLVINPNALLVTASHAYAGTLGHGMLVLDRANGRWAVVTKGLPSENVTAFAERNGELYVGTENGLVRIGEETLARAVGGRTQ
jgi:ligand-binding sensor domain-containing protein